MFTDDSVPSLNEEENREHDDQRGQRRSSDHHEEDHVEVRTGTAEDGADGILKRKKMKMKANATGTLLFYEKQENHVQIFEKLFLTAAFVYSASHFIPFLSS